MAKPKRPRQEQSPEPPRHGWQDLPIPEELKGVADLSIRAEPGKPAAYAFPLGFPAMLTAIVRSEEASQGVHGDDRRDGLPGGDRRGDPRTTGAFRARRERQPADGACRPPAGLRGWTEHRLRRRRSRHAHQRRDHSRAPHRTHRCRDRDPARSPAAREMARLAHARPHHVVRERGRGGDVADADVDQRPEAARPVIGCSRSPPLGHQGRSTLGARCELPPKPPLADRTAMARRTSAPFAA